MLNINLRGLGETDVESGSCHITNVPVSWDAKSTAAVVCDMWDRHWCKGAEARVGEMTARMNAVIKELRNRGVLIIHAPSDTMEFYIDHPGRRLALSAPPVETPVPLHKWMGFSSHREKVFPIDDSDSGCDCEPVCNVYYPWRKQIESIEIMEGDAIGDGFEIIYLLRQRNIENIIVMGVHTNFCVLGRPFGIRQLVLQGFNVVLMRDMTDTLYNPKMRPFADHFTGTDLVVRHIEKCWCPTISSDQIIGGAPFRFKEDTRV